MLTPRYRNFTESVSDFNRIMDGMNRIQPLEKSSRAQVQELTESAPAVYQTDPDMRMMLDSVYHYMPHDIKTTLNIMFEEEQRLADIYDKVKAGRIHFTEDDKAAMKNRHVEAAAKFNGMADKLGRISQTAHSQSEREQYSKMNEAARRKAKQHESKVEDYSGKRALNNSLDPAPLSRYQTEETALQSFRVLAGLDGSVMMPRDPGMSGTTNFNDNYLAEGRAKSKLPR